MLHIDFETRSVVDLRRTGVYPYVADKSTDVNCLGWAIEDEPVDLWLPGMPPPKRMIEAINDGIMVAAWNAQFERLVWNRVLAKKYGFPTIPLEKFYCIAALSRARGFPGALDKASRFAGLNIRKDMDGHYIMLKLCKPRRIEEDGTIVWWDSPDEYIRQGEYCKQDVEVERAMFHYFIPFSDEELSDYHLSEEINDRGICVDTDLCRAAVEGVAKEKITSSEALIALTDGQVSSHTQVPRILEWVAQEWKPLDNLAKSTVQDAMLEEDIPSHVYDVLEIRLEQARAAVSKYTAILDAEIDGVIRGLFMYRGAGQTGRFTATKVQVHNLVSESNLAAIPILKKHGVKALKMLGDPIHLLAQMVRPTFIARPKKTFLVGDFSQIEVRVLAWLAGEEKLLKVFRENGDPYCTYGTRAYNRVITKADVKERKASKACVLGLGFGGAEGALARSLKKDKIVLPHEELTHHVSTYRDEYSCIRQLWYALRDAMLDAMYSRGTIIEVSYVSYLYDGEHLWCRLPSGRLICYPFARVVEDKFGGDTVEYRRGNRSPKSGVTEWPVVQLWYGMMVENLAQAIAFDLLMGALRRMRRDWCVRLHVHDEIVPEVLEAEAERLVPEFLKVMTAGESWSVGLPIGAEVHVTPRYTK